MAAPTFVQALGSNGTAASTFSVPMPTGMVAGNVALMIVGSGGSAAFSLVNPFSGWVLIGSITGVYAHAVFMKVVDGTEPSSYSVFQNNGAVTWAASVIEVAGAKPLVTADAAVTASQNGTVTSLTAPTITTVWADDLLLCCWFYTSAQTPTMPGTLTAAGATAGNGKSAVWGYQTLSAAGATGTRVGSVPVATLNAGWSIALREPINIATTTVAPSKKIAMTQVITVYGSGAGATVADAQFGRGWGRYRVGGDTVDAVFEQPLDRDVYLLDRLTLRPRFKVRTKLADGALYSFPNLANDKYIVVGVDQTNVDNDVILAQLQSEAM